jgi:AcrR family transcriptional regulator
LGPGDEPETAQNSLPRGNLDGTLERVPRNRKPAGAYHHGDLRRALLEGALRFIEQHGLEALSLRELARRLGVSPAAPYHHFADRTALLSELAALGFQQLYATMQAELARAGQDPLERLVCIGRGYLRFASLHPSQFRLMFGTECASATVDPERPGGPAFTLLRDVVVAGLAAAGRSNEDPMPAILAMWAVVHGMATLRLDGPLGVMFGQAEFDRLADAALQVVRGSLAGRTAPRVVGAAKRGK